MDLRHCPPSPKSSFEQEKKKTPPFRFIDASAPKQPPRLPPDFDFLPPRSMRISFPPMIFRLSHLPCKYGSIVVVIASPPSPSPSQTRRQNAARSQEKCPMCQKIFALPLSSTNKCITKNRVDSDQRSLFSLRPPFSTPRMLPNKSTPCQLDNELASSSTNMKRIQRVHLRNDTFRRKQWKHKSAR